MIGGTISLTIPQLKNMEEGLVSPHWLVTTCITPSFLFSKTNLAKIHMSSSKIGALNDSRRAATLFDRACFMKWTEARHVYVYVCKTFPCQKLTCYTFHSDHVFEYGAFDLSFRLSRLWRHNGSHSLFDSGFSFAWKLKSDMTGLNGVTLFFDSAHSSEFE